MRDPIDGVPELAGDTAVTTPLRWAVSDGFGRQGTQGGPALGQQPPSASGPAAPGNRPAIPTTAISAVRGTAGALAAVHSGSPGSPSSAASSGAHSMPSRNVWDGPSPSAFARSLCPQVAHRAHGHAGRHLLLHQQWAMCPASRAR
ncbi:hypothetical protein SHIRM173S_07538 [Streptomyces hirsutus]